MVANRGDIGEKWLKEERSGRARQINPDVRQRGEGAGNGTPGQEGAGHRSRRNEKGGGVGVRISAGKNY